MPLLSVVIPTRNGALTLAAQLDALAIADSPPVPFEVVVADNGSTDGTAVVAMSYTERLPLRVIDAGRAPGINVARNEGVRAARGEWIVLCDSDDEVDAGWLVGYAAAFSAGEHLLGGPIDYRRLNTPEVRAWRGATSASPIQALGFLKSGHGANLGFTRALYDSIEGFDEDFTGGGDDTDFCWRAQLERYELNELDDVVVHYRLRPSLGALWRQSVGYGASEVLLYKKFSAKGMRRRPASSLLADVWWLLTRFPFALPIGRRGAWLRRLATQWGRLVGTVRHRTWWW